MGQYLEDEDGMHSLKYHNGFCDDNKQGIYIYNQATGEKSTYFCNEHG